MDHELQRREMLSDHGVWRLSGLKFRPGAGSRARPTRVEGSAAAHIKRAIRSGGAAAPCKGLNPERIGGHGFSAGGELAALAGNTS